MSQTVSTYLLSLTPCWEGSAHADYYSDLIDPNSFGINMNRSYITVSYITVSGKDIEFHHYDPVCDVLSVAGCSGGVQIGPEFERQLHIGRFLEIHQLGFVRCHRGHDYRSVVTGRTPKQHSCPRSTNTWDLILSGSPGQPPVFIN